MDLTFREAVWQEAETLIKLYDAAFYDDYMKYGQCPAYGRTKDEMEVSILRFPKELALLDGEIVGAISGQMVDFGVYEIGCLCVEPTHQKNGIGKALFEHFCSLHDDWKKITLITPADNEKNICFSCGFRISGFFVHAVAFGPGRRQ